MINENSPQHIHPILSMGWKWLANTNSNNSKLVTRGGRDGADALEEELHLPGSLLLLLANVQDTFGDERHGCHREAASMVSRLA